MRKITLIAIILFLTLPLIAQGAIWGDDFCREGEIVNYPSTQKLCKVMADVSDILFVAGIMLAVIVVIWGGIIYITSGGDENKTASGKKVIINGLIGAAIIFASGFLIGVVKEFIVDRLTNFGG